MKLKDIKDVLNFSHFLPEPDDGSAGWSRRFPKARTLLLNVTKSGISWAALDKGQAICETGGLEGTPKEVLGQVGEQWKLLCDEGWCAVSLSTRYVISLESNLSRRKGSDEQIRTNPKAALGAKAERGKRYSVEHNNESNTSILLAVEEDMIKRIETTLSEAGFHVGRIACGAFAMIDDLIGQVDAARKAQLARDPDAQMGAVVMIACCQGSVCVLTQREEQWVELRSRTDLYEGDQMEPVLGIVTPLIENAGVGAQVVFMNDTPGSALPALLQEKLPHVRISDVTVDNQLWNLLADL